MYNNYKDVLYGNSLWLLPSERRDRQLRELQLVNGNKIDHPETSSHFSLGGGLAALRVLILRSSENLTPTLESRGKRTWWSIFSR